MSWASKYIQIPFGEKGRDHNSCDCWGLACIVYKEERGIILPSYTEVYESTNDREILRQTIKSESNQFWQQVKKPEPFDMVLLKMRGIPMHVGIVIDNNNMLHCLKGVGTAIERFNSIKWQSNVMGFWRWVN